MADDEESAPSYLERVVKPGLLSPEQASEVTRRLKVATMALDRMYRLVQDSAVKLDMPGQGNEFDTEHRRVLELYKFSARELTEGRYVPIGEQPPQKRRVTARRLLPWKGKSESESEAVTPEIVSHIPPEEIRAGVAAGAESATKLCAALIGNILENYDYHETRWKTELRRKSLSHPKEMLEHLLIAYVGLGGEPDERMVQAIAVRTGMNAEKLVQRCIDDNRETLQAESVLDLLKPLGPPMLGRGGPS
jgi:hypothetical protein